MPGLWLWGHGLSGAPQLPDVQGVIMGARAVASVLADVRGRRLSRVIPAGV